MNNQIYTKELCMTEFSICRQTIPCKQFFEIQNNKKLTACFIFILEGSAKINNLSNSFNINENDLIYIPENTSYTIQWTSKNDIKYYIMTALSKDYLAPMINNSFSLQKIEELSNLNTKQTIDNIYSLMSTDERIYKIKAIGIYYQLYANIISYLKEIKKQNLSETLETAINYINENYNHQIDINDIAKASYISETRLFHIFNEQLKTTPINYRNRVRIQKSIELLKTDLSLEEIAYKVGFISVPFFYRTFKKITSITPNKYRKIIIG